MMQPFTTHLLSIIFIVFSTCSVLSLATNASFHEIDNMQNMKMIREYLKKINKHAEKTIKSPDGDLIGCVLFHKQPAFDHPLLKEKISMEIPKRSKRFNSTKTIQLWNANGEECPEGTIPIRRTTEEDILRATSLKRFLRKPTPVRKATENGHEFALGVHGPGTYFGVKADLSVWAPHVDVDTEFSSSQIWVTSNHTADLNIIEAGWQVYPKLYRDKKKPRVTVHWTADSYKRTGCFNLRCPGFVHTSSKISLGSALTPVSTYNGGAFHITLSIEKDESADKWFLMFGPDKEDIGYWPLELLPELKDYASFIELGGEVLNTASNGVHTTTQMGSGHFPNEGYKRAANVANIEITTVGNKPDFFYTVVSNRDCYDASMGDPKVSPRLGTRFFYGGPGRGFYCP